MELQVVRAVGRGGSERSAFDNALVVAGAGHLHVVTLGVPLPPGSRVREVERLPVLEGDRPGDRLYAALAAARTDVPGRQVWAGLRWAQDADTGAGLLVAAEAEREEELLDRLADDLRDAAAARGVDLGAARSAVVGAMCTGPSTCALVLCAFARAAWAELGQGTAA